MIDHEKNHECLEGNCALVVRAFACRRTNRERQHSWLLRFGGPRERQMAIKVAKSLFSTF